MTFLHSRGSCLLVAIAMVFGFCPRTRAHEIRPALLNISESSPGWFDVTWKVPMRGDRILAIKPILPSSLTQIGPPSTFLVPGARIERFTCKSDGSPLAGGVIAIDGLSTLQIDVLVRVSQADGTTHSAIIKPSATSYEIPTRASKGEVAWSYAQMGVIHIIEGIDHLLFLFALLLLVSSFGKLVKTITAFTLAHSVTLALATLGLVNIPTAPTEAVIALSIVFLATEIVRVRSGGVAFTQQRPWVVALVFGLFHGLGFAGALSDVGVPAHEVPLALLMFNVGVEAGQLTFVIAVVGLLALLRRIHVPGARRWLQHGWRLAPPYAIGCVAAFWTVQRVMSFL